MEDYYKEIATGKKTTIHQNLESLKSEEEVTKKLDERKHRWLQETKLMWKDLCHMNFELLNAKDQQAVVDFCPKADKVIFLVDFLKKHLATLYLSALSR